MFEAYGDTKAEKLTKENNFARKIVKEISDFGVSERQKYLIMYYLSFELENIEKMKLISGFLKENCEDLTITGMYGGNE